MILFYCLAGINQLALKYSKPKHRLNKTQPGTLSTINDDLTCFNLAISERTFKNNSSYFTWLTSTCRAQHKILRYVCISLKSPKYHCPLYLWALHLKPFINYRLKIGGKTTSVQNIILCACIHEHSFMCVRHTHTSFSCHYSLNKAI